MDHIILGRTGLSVSHIGFGAIPIQRIPQSEAVYLVKKALDHGINFFDTARSYTDSEEKIGLALGGLRERAIIATKSMSKERGAVLKDLETSLRKLKTDYIDVYQLHHVQRLPDPGDPGDLYDALLVARAQGKVRFIGLSAHRLDIAVAAVDSGLYDTVQYPVSILSTPEELGLIERCREKGIGLIGMKGLSGGLLTNAAAAYAFLRQYDNVVPIWGIQRISELDEFLHFVKEPPVLDAEMWRSIERDRAELGENFCRGCGYCLPCPAGIPIPMAARMSLLLRRMPYQRFLTEDWRKQMECIKDCQECGHCREHCPYKLDTPELLKMMLADYEEFSRQHSQG